MQDKADVLVLCQLFYPELVSTGQTLTELCEVLDEMGIGVEVLCARPTVMRLERDVPREITHRGIRIRRVWGTSFPKLNLFGRLANQLTYAASTFLHLLFHRRRRPILVLTNPPFLALACAVLSKFGLGNRYVYVIFDVYPDTAVSLGVIAGNGLLARFWEWVNGVSYRHADKVVVIGRCMKGVIQRKLERHGVPEQGKLEVIHMWSDDGRIHPVAKSDNPYVRKWSLDGKFVVAYFGNMGRFHDLETIMEAARRLRGDDGIAFLFVGEGHKKVWSMEFARSHGLANCQFHTYVDREDLTYSLTCCDVGLVSLTKGQEGLSVPSKTYAMMAAAAPIIALLDQSSEVAKVLQECDCGIVMEPGDADSLVAAILSLYSDRLWASRLGANGRRAIDERYNLKSAAEAYGKIIRELN